MAGESRVLAPELPNSRMLFCPIRRASELGVSNPCLRKRRRDLLIAHAVETALQTQVAKWAAGAHFGASDDPPNGHQYATGTNGFHIVIFGPCSSWTGAGSSSTLMARSRSASVNGRVV